MSAMLKKIGSPLSSLRYRFLKRAIPWLGEFDPKFYLNANPDVAIAGLAPLDHYIRFGRREGRHGSPSQAPGHAIGLTSGETKALSTDWASYAAIVAAAHDPDFNERYEDIKASGLFDAAFYARHAPAMKLKRDPLLDYQIWGWREFWDPSPEFNTLFYVASHPDVRVADTSPLSHYFETGRARGYPTVPPKPGFTWVNSVTNPDDRNPSDDVHVEQRRGVGFFTRFGFSWEDGSSDEFTDLAIAELAERTPLLQIDETSPDATIVIPVHGQSHFLLSCLDSLSQHSSKYSVEIVVMDDVSPDFWNMGRIAAIPWIRYVPLQDNVGFVKNCNHGASLARGKYLILLNSDTRVVTGWLDSLLDTLGAKKKAGLVGSKLLHGDGSLQEAGGTIWRDGSAWNCGRGADPIDARYCYARPVDYCSGASIAIPRAVWQEVGGFDTDYSPAYYEDVDLAFRLREAGYEVWYQAWSRVVHYEGKTHGVDVKKGLKAYQERNRKLFSERWREVLVKHRGVGDAPLLSAHYKDRPRVLVMDQLTPTPDKDAGSVVADSFLRMFEQEGWCVTFAPVSFRYDGDYTARLQRIGIEVVYQPHFTKIQDVIRTRSVPFDFILAFRVATLSENVALLRETYPMARIVFHDIDLHYLRTQRAAEVKNDTRLRIEAELLKDQELELITDVDCSLVPSDHEREVIRQEVPMDNILVFPILGTVRRSKVPFGQRRDLCFVGGFAHEPNIDAVHYFVEDIWPLIKSQLPKAARFHIVGPGAPKSIQRLHGDNIVVAGHLPKLDEMFDRCRVFVAPLRYGAGVKGKLVSSLSNGVPSVASSLGAEGMGLVPDRDILIADDAQAFAKAVVNLYNSEETWLRIQAAGYDFIEENCSWEAGLKIWKRMLNVADETWIGRHTAKRRSRLADRLKVNPAGAPTGE